MEIKKIYKSVNPELLYDEIRDFVSKQGAILDDAKLQTHSLPGGASHITRATLAFKTEEGKSGKECLRAHIVGSAGGETKMMLDINEELFHSVKTATLEEDLRFIFGSYEAI